MCGEVAQGKDGSVLTCVKERLPRLPVLETLWTGINFERLLQGRSPPGVPVEERTSETFHFRWSPK